MTDTHAIFDKLRASAMNNWVGGGDPGFVGGGCYFFLNRATTLRDGMKVLDFGCGIGRVTLAYLYERPDVEIVGFDIMEPVITFCGQEIAPHFPNSRFELVADSNAHYDGRTGGGGRKSRSELATQYSQNFDLAYAFSVFTHVEASDLEGLFGFIATMLKPGGSLYLTAFIVTPYARQRIAAHGCDVPFPKPAFESDGRVFVGNTDDRLAFIAFDPDLIYQAALKADLCVGSMELGSWSGDCNAPDVPFQDGVVLRKRQDGAA